MKLILPVLALFYSVNTFSSEDAPDLIIEELQQNVYLHKSFSYTDSFGLVSSNGLVVVKATQAFIVDTPWSERDTEKLVKWIEEKNLQLIGSISTHSHDDRTAGIKWLNSHSVPTYASVLTNNILKQEGKELASVSLQLATDVEYSMAGGMLQVYYPGGGHALDNIVVWLPESNILFGGCLVRSLGSKNLGYTGEAHIDKWPSSIQKLLLKYANAKLVVPGHGKVGDVQLLNHTKILAELALNKLASEPLKSLVD